jgi:alkanesulfonate monooxygenase SsuD/methylene tetrahydromethanopterin reductase-like flavin-dependent oxidoreductase (luciferase family)
VRVGVSLYFQGYQDWDRFEAHERGEGEPLDPTFDSKRWTEELDSALMIEDLGFDSIWAVEHHVSPYTMINNPIQLLSFVAGATKRVDVGTMVVVLPWHHPLRVAEDMTMLQYLLRGRTPFIGVGRGLGRREFRQLGVDMNESAERMAESVQIIQLAIKEEIFSFRGKHYTFEDVSMRPRPLDAQALLDAMHFSWGSPTSAPIGASFGLKPLIIPQRPWEAYQGELESFSKARRDAGYLPARPRLHLNCYVAETHQAAEEGAWRYNGDYCDSASRNYEIFADHFKSLRGYEHYAEMSKNRPEGDAGLKAMVQMYVANHIWGTPDECIEKLSGIAQRFHPEEYMLTMRYGSMTKDESDKQIELFSREVLPALHDLPTYEAIDYAGTTSPDAEPHVSAERIIGSLP